MSEMTERVAQAIKAAGDECYGKGMNVSDACNILARAAIAAMREPTETMVEVGFTEASDSVRGDTGPDADIAQRVWRVMAHEALK